MIYMFLEEPSESIKNRLLYNQIDEPIITDPNQPLTLTNKSSEPVQIKIVNGTNFSFSTIGQYQFSINDSENWEEYTGNIIILNKNDKVLFKANEGFVNNSTSNNAFDIFQITGSQDIDISGNMQWLINSDTLLNTVNPYQFYNMFKGCTSLTSAPELPAKTLANSCYDDMFKGCTSLTSAPELPAKTLANSCYADMFKGCTSLTSAPELPAKTLAEYCYFGMFQNCSLLTSAPALPAETLADYCYATMFSNCTSLLIAPKIFAQFTIEPAIGSLLFMFEGCTSLTSMSFPNMTYTEAVNTIENYRMLESTSQPITIFCKNYPNGKTYR